MMTSIQGSRIKLDFELRIFVNSLADRLIATDEINRRVGELFTEHAVDIAFNQLDVWLHRPSGEASRAPKVSAGSTNPSEHPPPGVRGDPGNLDISDAGGGDAGR